MNKMHKNWRENSRGLVIAYPIPGSMYDGGYMGVGLGMEIGEKKITHQRKHITSQIRGTGRLQIKT